MSDKIGLVCTNQPQLSLSGALKYLGNWCDVIDDKSSNDIIDYHWNNRDKYYKDFLMLSRIYEEELQALSSVFSEIHSESNNEQYWRIVIGPWLFYFILVLYDRWYMLKNAKENHSVDFIYGSISTERIFLKNHQNFDELATQDALNQQIYDDLADILNLEICKSTPSPVTIKASKRSIFEALIDSIHFFREKGSEKLKGLVNKISVSLVRSGPFFIATRIPPLELLKLQGHLGLAPCLFFVLNKDNVVYSQPNIMLRRSVRQKVSELSLPSNPFTQIVRKLLHLYIPISYLEGYLELKERGQLLFPKKASTVIDGSAWNSNDCFKIYIATRVLENARLLVLQHGGSYGIAKWNWSEDHQFAIGDAFYSWGWNKNVSNCDIIPAFIQNVSNLNIQKSNDHRGILIVVTTVPKYCIYGSAFPVGYDQWLRGFNELLQMAKLLDHKRIPRVTFRPSMTDFGLNQTQRIRRSLPNVEIDDGSRRIYKVLGDHKLIIATSNTTSFLETYALNIPTILFWDSCLWETNESGDELFSRMRDLNLFFSSPQDLAEFLNDNYSSIDSWWDSKDIQDMREELCLTYANTTTNFSVDFAKLLNKEIGQT